MSEPISSDRKDGAASAAGAAAAPVQRRRRVIDTLTFVLLCAAVGVVAVSVSPEVLRAAGFMNPAREVPFRQGGRLSLLPHRGETPSHPFFPPEAEDEDEEARVTELERLYPDGMWPGRRSPEERRREQEMFPKRGERRAEAERPGPRVHDPSSPHAGSGEVRARFGVVRHRITLIEQPGGEGRVLGYVEPGKLVMVIKEVGDFALVAYTGEDGVLMGWTKKSEIAVR